MSTQDKAIAAIKVANATYLDENSSYAAMRTAEIAAKQAVAEHAKELGVDPVVAAIRLRQITG